MNSKFLTICEQIRKTLNEADNGTFNPIVGGENNTMMGQTNTNPDVQPAEEMKVSDELETKTQLIPNEQIISVTESLKRFLQNDKLQKFLVNEKILDDLDINKISMMPNIVSDKNAFEVLSQLNNIFNIDKNSKIKPELIPNSDLT